MSMPKDLETPLSSGSSGRQPAIAFNVDEGGGGAPKVKGKKSVKVHIPEKHVKVKQDILRPGAKSIFNKKFEHELEEKAPDSWRTLTHGLLGFLVQCVLLVGAVAAYVGNPVVATWAKTKPLTDAEGTPLTDPVSGRAMTQTVSSFMEVFVIFWMKFNMFIIGLIYAIVLDARSSSKNNKYVKLLFSRAELRKWFWISLMWCLADVAEQMAAGRIAVSTYTVLNQGRLLATAILMRILFGPKTTELQWSILVVLTILVIAWNFIPDDFSAVAEDAAPTSPVGLAATFVKVFGSTVAGVLAQSLFQGGDKEPAPFIIQQAHQTGIGVFWMLILIPSFVFYLAPDVMGEPWWDYRGFRGGGFYGWFGAPPYCSDGSDVVFNTDNPEGECLTGIRIAPTWGVATICVICFAMFRDYMVNYVLKVFDGIVKNLCGALATVVAYAIDVVVLGEVQFNIVKGMLAMVLTLDIANYAIAGIKPKVIPVSDEFKQVNKSLHQKAASMRKSMRQERGEDSDSDDDSSSSDEDMNRWQTGIDR